MPLPRTLARFNRVATNRVTLPFAAVLPWCAVVVHKGRHTGRAYRTPVLAFRRGDTFVIVLTYSSGSDWVANVRAASRCTIVHGGRMIELDQPELLQGATAEAVFPRLLRPLLRSMAVFEALRLRRSDVIDLTEDDRGRAQTNEDARRGGCEPQSNG